jgi:mannose-1-phosphate guanylyltransferase / mannose-6-phosphate isomerase
MNSPTPHSSIVASVSEGYSERYAIILAGGSGTRLWPLSRTTMPKQLLALNGDSSLLQQTAQRLLPMVSSDHVVTVTHQDHRFEVMGQLHAISPQLASAVLAEPVGRNTLPAIAWATAKIARKNPDALIGVFSSDHAVADEPAFRTAWTTCEVAARAGYLALFGMEPTEPATGYGYIESGDLIPAMQKTGGSLEIRHAIRFVEKPQSDAAARLLEKGGHYWNAGMFVFQADTFLGMLEQQSPDIFNCAKALADSDNTAASIDMYAKLPDLSIDYGILERADRVAVIPVSMGWSDLGSWEAIYQQHAKDRDGNVVRGQVVTQGGENNLLWSEHGLIATLGLSDTAVVQTRDATLVCPRNRVADLKLLVGKIKEKHQSLTETHLTVTRPWGSYTVLEEGPGYKIKRILVNPGAKLSMQMHYHRSEHWVVVAGTAKITNGDLDVFLEENQSTYIPKTHRHRLENPGRIPLQIIEIQSGAYLEEDDIVRFGDVYGRT